MKAARTIVAALCLLLPSCVAGKGEGWAAVAFGTDASKLDIGPDGIHATDLKQSPGLQQLRKQLVQSATVGAAVGHVANGIGVAIKNVTTP